MTDGGEPTLHFRTCPLCEATCGLELAVDDGRVVRVRGDRDDVFSHGFVCPKGTTLGQLDADPDRLRRPLVRRGPAGEGATWEEVSWPEAFRVVEERLAAVSEATGRESVAAYLGNPNVHHMAGMLYMRPFLTSIGTRHIYSATSVDQLPRYVSCGQLFGRTTSIPVPDVDRSDLLVVLGANPWESNGSLWTAPDLPGRLTELRRRGGRLVVIDPVRTRTAEHADEHHFVRPGTDALLVAAMARTLASEGLVDLGPAEGHVSGLEELAASLAPFEPERVAEVVGIDAATIRRLARELAATPRAALYGRIGTNVVRHGALTAWAIDVVNVLAGNLDHEGGMMFPLPAHGPRPRTAGGGRGFRMGRFRSRVRGLPEVGGELPVAALAEEIDTPGDGRIRALFTVGGNPVLSTPNGGRLEAALAELDLVVSVDPYLNETTRHADVILPPAPPLTRSHYDLAFNGLAIRNVANWSPPLFDVGDGMAEHEILARLALIASGMGADGDPAVVDDIVQRTLLERATASGPLAGRDPDELSAALEATDPCDRALEIMVRTGPYGDLFGAEPEGLTFGRLAESPHGIDLGPLAPRIPEILQTVSGTVELAPGVMAPDLEELAAGLDAGGPTPDEEHPLALIGRRHVRSNNSWMHNVEVLVKGRDRTQLWVHPADAEALGLRDGGRARVRSRVGEVVATVEVTDRIMPGVVSLPHGWGHDAAGTRLTVAARRPGVNVNRLTDDGVVDGVSGNAVLNGVPVRVTAA